MIAVFASAGVFVLVLILIFAIIVVRWKRRKDLIESALDFSPTNHLVDDDNYSRGGSGVALISRGSGSLSSETRGSRPRVPSVAFGANTSVPGLAPAPIPAASIPAPREMQQRGFGTGYIGDRWLDRGGESSGARYAYGNSAPSYYDTVRQQQLQYQPQQQQPRTLHWLQKDDRPLPPNLPTDVDPIPPSLVPSSRRDTTVFDVPFAATVTRQPSQLSMDGGLEKSGAGATVDRTWGSRASSTRERRQTQQVPLPPPPAARFSRKLSDTPGRNDEAYGGLDEKDINVGGDRSRVLKVRRFA